jgi:hypothetical protein
MYLTHCYVLSLSHCGKTNSILFISPKIARDIEAPAQALLASGSQLPDPSAAPWLHQLGMNHGLPWPGPCLD